jgi:hypothetical protein
VSAAPPLPPDPAAEAFYSGAYRRMAGFMLALGLAALAPLWWKAGGRFAFGYATGCAIAFVNFYWLKRGVEALADAITRSGQPRSGKGIVLRFLLRYLLIALGAYAIFRVSAASVYGLLTGLCLPVAGILCEAGYEVVVSVRRGY